MGFEHEQGMKNKEMWIMKHDEFWMKNCEEKIILQATVTLQTLHAIQIIQNTQLTKSLITRPKEDELFYFITLLQAPLFFGNLISSLYHRSNAIAVT